MPKTRTPAGARLDRYRNGRWVRIEIDRWPIDDADDQQQSLVEALGVAAARRCFARGRRNDILLGAGPTFWALTCDPIEEARVLAALLGIEAHDMTPAEKYITDVDHDPEHRS